jgi:hypothetical protein
MTTPTDPGVYLYEHIDYQGRVLRLTDSHPYLPALGFNNMLSSWRIVGDYSATVFTWYGYIGRRSTLGLRNNLGLPGGTMECPDLRLNPPSGIGITGNIGCFGEVKNDEASSIGVGTASFNRYASQLFWPPCTWAYNAGTMAGISVWAFGADGTYELSTITPANRSLLRGRWRNLEPDFAFLRPRSLLLYQSFEYATGNPVRVADQAFAYQIISDNTTVLRVRFNPPIWTEFEVRPA